MESVHRLLSNLLKNKFSTFVYYILIQITVFCSFYFFRDIFLWDENQLAALETASHAREVIFVNYLDIFGDSRLLHFLVYVGIRAIGASCLYAILRKIRFRRLSSVFVGSLLVLAPQFPYHQFPYLFSAFSINLALILFSIYISILEIEAKGKKFLILNASAFIINFLVSITAFPVFLPLELLRIWACRKYWKGLYKGKQKKFVSIVASPLLAILTAAIYSYYNPANSHDYSIHSIIANRVNSLLAEPITSIHTDLLMLINEIHKHAISGWLHPYTSYLSSMQTRDVLDIYPNLAIRISCVILLFYTVTIVKSRLQSLETSNSLRISNIDHNSNQSVKTTLNDDLIDIMWMSSIIIVFASISVITARPFSFFPDVGLSRYAYITTIPSSIILYIILKRFLKVKFLFVVLTGFICMISTSIIASNYYSYNQISDLHGFSNEKFARFGNIDRRVWYVTPNFNREASIDYFGVYKAKLNWATSFSWDTLSQFPPEEANIEEQDYILGFRNYLREDACVNFLTNSSLENSGEANKYLNKYKKPIRAKLINNSNVSKIHSIKDINNLAGSKIKWIEDQLENKHSTNNQKYCILFQSLQHAIDLDNIDLMEYIVNKRDELGIGTVFPEEEYYPFIIARDKIKTHHKRNSSK